MAKKVAYFDGLRIPKQKIALRKKRWSQLRKAHSNKQRKVNSGTWRLKQTTNYIKFLEDNSQELRAIRIGEKTKIYDMMASSIKSRTALQCRSHHQKMMKTHGSIDYIIQYYSQVVIPYFKMQEAKLKNEKYKKQPKRQYSFYKISIIENRIRIQIDSSRIWQYCYDL